MVSGRGRQHHSSSLRDFHPFPTTNVAKPVGLRAGGFRTGTPITAINNVLRLHFCEQPERLPHDVLITHPYRYIDDMSHGRAAIKLIFPYRTSPPK